MSARSQCRTCRLANHYISTCNIKKPASAGFLLTFIASSPILNINMNKYQTWYQQIIDRARGRTLTGYVERHHVVPHSLGGSDHADNLVRLTAREHFVCHWLLTKIYTGESRYKMLDALRMMRAEKKGQKRYKTKITARVYERIKKEYAQLQSQRYSGENNPMYGDKFYRSDEGKKRQREAILGDKNGSKQLQAREKIADSKLGKKREPFSDEWRNNMSKNHKSKQSDFDGTLKEETKKKIGDKIRGRRQTDEEKARRSAANTGKIKPKKLCPHCDRMIAVNTYARWHGDQCGSRGIS